MICPCVLLFLFFLVLAIVLVYLVLTGRAGASRFAGLLGVTATGPAIAEPAANVTPVVTVVVTHIHKDKGTGERPVSQPLP